MLLSLFISFVGTNFSMFYLLHSQRHSRKTKVSYHAADSRNAYIIYALGHAVGGLFFLIFARQLFYDYFGSGLLWWAAVGGVVSEQIQGIVPAKGKWEGLHTIGAWGMAGFMSLILVVAPIVYAPRPHAAIAQMLGLAILTICFILARYAKGKYFWAAQAVYFSTFYVFLALIATNL